MGYNFRIEYKTGASNKVADALSGRNVEVDGGDGDLTPSMPDGSKAPTDKIAQALMAASHPIPDIFEILRRETQTMPDLLELQVALQHGTTDSAVSLVDGLINFNRIIYVSRDSEAKVALLHEHHTAPAAGLPGVYRTFRRLAASFYWKGMRKDVKKFIEACYDCQTTKYSTQRPAGLLQPLLIPSQVWEDVSMDFIIGLPPSRGYTGVMVVVDHLSKYANFSLLPVR